MELRVEAAESLPEGSYIAVRIGDVQKQTLYDPKKVYRFSESRRFGKIDVYQRMGTCDVVWGADQPECRVCKVVNNDGDTGTRLKVHINRPIGTGVKPDTPAQGGDKLDAQVNSMIESPSKASLASAKSEKNKEASAAARRYLQEHDVEGILTGAMRALLKTLPEDAPGFLCHYITSRYAAKQEQPVAVPKPPVAAVTRPAGQNLWQVGTAGPPQFKDYYCKFMLPARGGGFWQSFHQICDWPRPARKPQTATVIREEDRFGHKPSVGTWMAKPPRTRKPKISVDGLRTQAREALIGASLNGKLDKALSECLSGQDANPAGVDVEQLRLKTRNIFLQASSDGSLNNVLNEARVGSGGTPMFDLEEFRKQARSVVLKASAEGTLEQALVEALDYAKSQPSGGTSSDKDVVKPEDMDKLRLRACGILSQAQQDGSFVRVMEQAALNRGTDSIEDLRCKARNILNDCCQDGRLTDAVQSASMASSLHVEDLRAQACTILMKAHQDGTLAQALVNSQRTMPMNELRAQACRMMVKAAEDNTLAQVLAEIPQKRKMASAEEIQKLRNQALNVLIEASDNNSLSKAMNDVAQSRSELVQGDIHELKKHAIEILMKASQEGALARIFDSVLQSKYEVRDVCAQACNVLITASANGSLAKALTEMSSFTKPMVEVDALRKKACSLLVSASHDGRLEQAMQELRQNGLNHLDPAAVRVRVATLLSQALSDGSLEKVVREVGEDDYILGMQKQTRDALLQGVSDGSLEKVLCDVQEKKEVYVLREQACAIFEKAANDGRLKDALAASPVSKDVNALRIRACEAFVQGCYDGSLQQALGEVAEDKTTKVSARFPGASRQTKAAWSNAPSVGTWNNQRRARPPCRGQTAAARSWLKKPSVGTWLSHRPKKNVSMEELRDYARDVFVSSCRDGTLSGILKSIPAG